MISDQLQTVTNILEKLSSAGDLKAHFLKLLNTLQLLKAHLDLTSKILETSTAEEVTSVKTTLKLKGKEYEQIVSKEDLNLVMIKYALEYLNGRLLKNLEDIIKGWATQETRDIKKIEVDGIWLQTLVTKGFLYRLT